MRRIVICLLAVLTTATVTPVAGGWTDDWFDNAVITGSGSFANQQRGFYTAGGFQARLNTATDHPITVSLPRLNSGCGGVDLFLGGMSFLDADYLVEKFQNIIQAAPALAFDIALKVMAKELSDSMSKLEGATNWLNNLQLDDCAISNRVVTAVAEDDPDILGSVWNEVTSGVSLRDSINKSYDDAQKDIQSSNSNPIVDLKDEISECPADFKTIFSAGSLIDNATTLFGVPGNASIIRGYIGDVLIRADSTDLIPIVTRIDGCPANDQMNIEDMLEGTAEAKQNDGTCTLDNTQSIIEIIGDRLTDIAAALEAKTNLTSAQITFIENTPIPVYSIIRKAIAKQNVGMTVSLMTDVVATAYAYKIFDDLYRNTQYMFKKIQTISTVPGVDPSAAANKCNPSVYKHAIVEFAHLQASVGEVRKSISGSYAQKMQENLTHWNFAKVHADDERRLRAKDSLDAIE